MAAVTADPARELTLYFRINRDGRIVFSFLDENGDAFDFTDYTPVVNFKTRKNDPTNVLQLTDGSGLDISGGDITMVLTDAQAAAFREQTYFWELVITDPDDKVADWLTGDAIFHFGKFDGLQSTTESITISDSGSVVEVTVSIGGSGTTTGWATTGSTAVTNPTITGSTTFFGRQIFTNDPLNPQYLFSVPTVNSQSPDTPTNYGKFNHVLYDGGYYNQDGRPDSVYRYGWNVAPGGGPERLTEAMMSFSLENHYRVNGIYCMEIIWESNTGSLHSNAVNRHLYMLVEKSTGNAYAQWTVNSLEYFKPNSGMNPSSYFSVDSDGDMALNGTAAVFTMGYTNTALVFSAIEDGTGNVSITNGSSGSQKALTITSYTILLSNTDAGGNGLTIRNAAVSGGFGLVLDTGGSTVSGAWNPFSSVVSATGALRGTIRNTNAGAGAHAELYLQSLGGNPSTILYDGTNAWVVGMQHSDGKYKVGTAYGWGSNLWLSITQTGIVNLGNLPSSASGLSTNDLYKDGSGFLKAA